MSEKSSFEQKHPFLVCVDSDGCVFDVMEIKHKECFCPAYIEYFALQPVSRYARDAWDYANLYSVWRGVHRFKSLLIALDALKARHEVIRRGFTPPELPNLRKYIAKGNPLCNDGLEAHLAMHPEDSDIRTTLLWSQEVNRRIARMVHGVPPFPFVRESFSMLRGKADIVIVSATAQKALEQEWMEHGLLPLVSAVRGQESGTKKQIIASLKGAYEPHHVLMIGDAPGDMQAAHDNDALFYPICPENETASWQDFAQYGELFLSQAYGGAPEQETISRFMKLLPEHPFWTA